MQIRQADRIHSVVYCQSEGIYRLTGRYRKAGRQPGTDRSTGRQTAGTGSEEGSGSVLVAHKQNHKKHDNMATTMTWQGVSGKGLVKYYRADEEQVSRWTGKVRQRWPKGKGLLQGGREWLESQSVRWHKQVEKSDSMWWTGKEWQWTGLRKWECGWRERQNVTDLCVCVYVSTCTFLK